MKTPTKKEVAPHGTIQPDYFYQLSEGPKYFGYGLTQQAERIKSGDIPWPVSSADDGRIKGWYGRIIIWWQANRQANIDARATQLLPAPAAKGADDDLLTPCEVASWFGVDPQWLRDGRSKHYGPPFEERGTAVHYRRGAILAWLAEREFSYNDNKKNVRTKAEKPHTQEKPKKHRVVKAPLLWRANDAP